jgi:hypothetical protein
MAADVPFREVLKLNIEQSRRAFETLMATSEKAWAPAVWPLGDKIIKSFRDNAAAHFAFALRLIASKDASDALRLYAEHVEERTHTLSQQFQEISSLAVQIGAANKSEKLDDTSVTKKAAIKQDSPGTPTVPNALGTGKATAPSSHSGANGGLTSQVATALPSPPRAANRGGKGKKPRKIQNGPTEGGAASKPRKQRRPHRGAS